MGGLAGHMYHLYDNPGLTFGEIKDIFSKAADGKLSGTEKTDGLNIYISYSVRTGEVKAARNKSNIKDGGLNPEQLAQKFEGRENLKNAFIGAFDAFSAAIKKMNIEKQISVFGPDANIYYNAEIQNPETANVIQYGSKTLNIHRSGHAEYDKYTGKETDTNLTPQFEMLEKYLSSAENQIDQTQYKVVINAIRNLNALTDKSILKIAIEQITQIQQNFGLTDQDTIAQYLINIIDQQIEKTFPDLSNETKQLLLKRMMKVKGITVITVIKSIEKDLQPAYTANIKAFVEKESEIYKSAIAPIENIVHDFAVEMLRSLESAFILDNKKEVQRLKQELTAAKNAIEGSSNDQAMEILKNQFNKIKNIENITTAAEGFVFDYNGETYKFTGNFAPLNQILGLFKYGRGSIPALQGVVKEQEVETPTTNVTNTAVVIFGRFNPPTIGHAMLFKMGEIESNKENSDFFIVPSRKVDDKDNPLTFDEKIFYLQTMFPDYAEHIVDNSALTDIISIAKYFSSLGYKNLKMIAGSDRVASFENIKKYNNSPDYAYDNIDIISAGDRDPDSEGVAGMKASKMRQAAINGDLDTFMKGIAGSLNVEQAKLLLNTIRTRIAQKGEKRGQKNFLQPIAENILKEYIAKSGDKWCVFGSKKTKEGKKRKFGCYDDKADAHKRLGQVEYFKTHEELEEMSMASGAVQGHVNVRKKNPWNINKVIELEEENINNVYNQSMTSRYGISVQKRDDDNNTKLFKTGDEEKQMNSFMINRQNFIEEIKLRNIVREALHKKYLHKQTQLVKEEQQFREIIRKILREGEEDMPHKSTGINVLEDVLDGVMTTLEKSYKMGQTTPQQRTSFRAHIINAVKNLLSFERALEKPIEKDPKLANIEANPKFIKVGKEKSPEEQDTFSIEGEDQTGRNLALPAFEKIKKKIKDGYEMLADQKDKDMYYEYLITNLKLYFDKYELELNPNPVEPTTPSYENEVDKEQSETPDDGVGQIADTAPAGEEVSGIPSGQPQIPAETGLTPETELAPEEQQPA
jgi:hypothetical protein